MNPIHNTKTTSFDPGKESSREAADRTLMAWIRTSLSLIGFGFGIAKYREILLNAGMVKGPPEEINTTVIFGLSFIFLGTFALLAAVIKYWRGCNLLWGRGLNLPVSSPWPWSRRPRCYASDFSRFWRF